MRNRSFISSLSTSCQIFHFFHKGVVVIDIQDYAFLFPFVVGDKLNFGAHAVNSSGIGDFVEFSLSGDRGARSTSRRALES